MADLHKFASRNIIGAMPPPPGVTPNFIDPYSLSKYNILTSVICIAMGTIFVWMRLYTKIFIMKVHGWEDHTCFIAWLGSLAISTMLLVGNRYGGGVHAWNVPLTHFTRFLILLRSGEIIYGPLLFIIKLSILLQYQRIFVPLAKGKVYYHIRITIVLNLLFYVAILFVAIFRCSAANGRCLDIYWAYFFTAVVNIISDFQLFLLPLSSLWHLQLPMQKKLGLCAVFAIGLLTCISSILRLIQIVGTKSNFDSDTTFTSLPLLLWTQAEITGGIICSCIPLLPRFFQQLSKTITAKMKDMYRRNVKHGPNEIRDGFTIGKPPTPLRSPRLFEQRYPETNKQDTGIGHSIGLNRGISDSSDHIQRRSSDIESQVLEADSGVGATVPIKK